MKITFFKNEWLTKIPPSLSVDFSWADIITILTTFIKTESKEETEMYNLWEFRVRNNQIHRCRDDCLFLHGLVLDYDENLSLEDAIKQYFDFECVIYTTYNHRTSGKDKFRVVIPFATPMPIEEFDKKRNDMIDSFPGVDRASFTRSQAVFLHSGPDEEHAFSAHLKGLWLDWTAFEDEEVIEYSLPRVITQSLDPLFDVAYRTAVIDSLLSCSGLKHMDSMSLVIIMKSCGSTFADYQYVVSKSGAAGSCIHQLDKQTDVWNSVPDGVRIKRDKRDKFIKKHGGKQVVIKQAGGKNVLKTRQELEKQIRDLEEEIRKLKENKTNDNESD